MDEQSLKGKTILVVDDEVDLRDIVASEFEYMGAVVHQAENIAVAQKLLNAQNVDLVVSDIRMPGGTGIDLLAFIKNRDVFDPPIILITGFADVTTEEAFNKGAEALMNKPFKLDDLIKLAVKHTSPLEERFNEAEAPTQHLKFEFKETLEEMIALKQLAIGRGGIAICLESHGKKMDLGETVSFDLSFGNIKLKGRAVSRWFKATDHSAQKASIGLEFSELDKESLKFIMAYCQNKRPTSFIPSLDKK